MHASGHEEMELVLSASSGSPHDNGTGVVHVWDPRTGVQWRQFKNNRSCTNGLAVVACDMGGTGGAHPEFVMACQSNKPAVHCWDFSKEQLRFKSSSPEALRAIAATPRGEWVVCGGISGKCFIWQTSTGEQVRAWKAHFKSVSALAVSSCGTFVVTGGKDALVHVWTLVDVLSVSRRVNARITPVASFTAHTLAITSVVVGSGGVSGRVVSSSLDCTVKMWDIATKSMLLSVVCPTFVTSVALDPLELRMFMGGGDGRIFELDLHAASAAATHVVGRASKGGGRGSESLQVFTGHSSAVTSLSVGSDGDILVSASLDGSVRVWDCGSRQQLRSFDKHQAPVSCATIVRRSAAVLRATSSNGTATLSIAPFRKSLNVQALKAPIAVPALNTGNATGRDPMRPAHAPAASEKTEEPPTVASPGRAAAAEPVDETQTQTRAQQQRDEGALTRAHAEIARLKDENARWKAVNNAMFAKLEEAQKAAAGKAQQRSKKRKASRGASGGDDGGGGGANGGDKRSRR